MNKKRNLYSELNIVPEHSTTPLKITTKEPSCINIAKMKLTVHNRISALSTERSTNIMLHKKKFPIIAIIVTLILSVSAFATSNIITSWSSSSSPVPDFSELPTLQECTSKVNFVPVLIETFQNGYSFSNGYVVKNDFKDSDYNSLKNFNSLKFTYVKNGDTVHFNQQKKYTDIGKNRKIIANIEGLNIYYNSYIYKVVPEDYELTKEDKAAEKNGELVFSYGSEQVQIINVHGISWCENDIAYSLIQLSGKLSSDDLLTMAQEIISK